MEFKKIFLLLIIHLELFLFGSLIFILLFQTSLFDNVNVFFYRGISLLIISSLFTLFISFIIKFFSKERLFTFRDVIISFVLIFCINLVFFTHLPVTAERSVSVFLLSYMSEKRESYLTEEEITRVFVQEYLYENKNIQKRFNEQLISGNVVEENGNFRITQRGMWIIKIYKFLGDLFDINKENIEFY